MLDSSIEADSKCSYSQEITLMIEDLRNLIVFVFVLKVMYISCVAVQSDVYNKLLRFTGYFVTLLFSLLQPHWFKVET